MDNVRFLKHTYLNYDKPPLIEEAKVRSKLSTRIIIFIVLRLRTSLISIGAGIVLDEITIRL